MTEANFINEAVWSGDNLPVMRDMMVGKRLRYNERMANNGFASGARS